MVCVVNLIYTQYYLVISVWYVLQDYFMYCESLFQIFQLFDNKICCIKFKDIFSNNYRVTSSSTKTARSTYFIGNC